MSVAVPIISTWDGENRRAYLAEGVSDFYPIEDVYHEYRNQRRLDLELRKYDALLRAEGNISKGAGAFTPRYVVFLDNFKLIPFNDSDQINQLGDIITDDPDVDPTLYDTTTLTVPKVIYIKPSAAETIQLNSGSIVYSSFQGGVWYKASSPYSDKGTEAEPNGNTERPVNSISLAVEIANDRGFHILNLMGNAALGTGDDVSGMKIIGQSPMQSRLTILTEANVLNTEITNCTITGILDGNSIIKDCLIDGLAYITGYFIDCGLTIQPITLGSGTQASFINCFSNVSGTETPTVDMGGSGQSLAVRDYSGGIKIINRTGADPMSIDMDSGHIKIDETCTGAPITTRGVFKLTVGVGATEPDTSGRVMMASHTDDITDATWTHPDRTLTDAVMVDVPTTKEIALEVWSTRLPLLLDIVYPSATLYPSTTLYPTEEG